MTDAQVLRMSVGQGGSPRQGAGEDAPGTANTVQSLVWAPEKNGSCISLSIHDISSRHTIVTATISASAMRYLAIIARSVVRLGSARGLGLACGGRRGFRFLNAA